MNRTDPSQNRKLAPPGWKLDAEATNVSELPPTYPIVSAFAYFRNGLMGYMVQKLVSPKLPEHHQFQHTGRPRSSMPWARSLYMKVLLVPSVTDENCTQGRVNPG